jgi:hypothetical protein
VESNIRQADSGSGGILNRGVAKARRARGKKFDAGGVCSNISGVGKGGRSKHFGLVIFRLRGFAAMAGKPIYATSGAAKSKSAFFDIMTAGRLVPLEKWGTVPQREQDEDDRNAGRSA